VVSFAVCKSEAGKHKPFARGALPWAKFLGCLVIWTSSICFLSAFTPLSCLQSAWYSFQGRRTQDKENAYLFVVVLTCGALQDAVLVTSSLGSPGSCLSRRPLFLLLNCQTEVCAAVCAPISQSFLLFATFGIFRLFCCVSSLRCLMVHDAVYGKIRFCQHKQAEPAASFWKQNRFRVCWS